MTEPQRMNAEQTRRVRTLIRSLCANYDGGNCIRLDDGEPNICPQLITSSLICKYFRAAVLPADPALYDAIWRGRAGRRCHLCGEPVYSASNAAKYCPRCAVRERRRRDAERKRKGRNHVRK